MEPVSGRKLGWNDAVVLVGLGLVGYGVWEKTDQATASIVLGAILIGIALAATGLRALTAWRRTQ